MVAENQTLAGLTMTFLSFSHSVHHLDCNPIRAATGMQIRKWRQAGLATLWDPKSLAWDFRGKKNFHTDAAS